MLHFYAYNIKFRLHFSRFSIIENNVADVANLEKKGLVIREPDENDKRANKVYVTDLAQEIIQSDLGGESMFYEWLTDGMEEEELARFADTLSRLAQKARNERMAQFVNFTKWAQDHREEV